LEFFHSSLSFTPISCFRWQVPTTLLPPGSDNPLPRRQQSDYALKALRNMRLLNTLEFENIFRWSQGSPDTLSLFLSHIPSVENLVLRSSRSRGAEVEGSVQDVQVSSSLPVSDDATPCSCDAISVGLGLSQPQVCRVNGNALGQKVSSSFSYRPAIVLGLARQFPSHIAQVCLHSLRKQNNNRSFIYRISSATAPTLRPCSTTADSPPSSSSTWAGAGPSTRTSTRSASSRRTRASRRSPGPTRTT
jgi:hypothetical protein